MSKPKYYRLKNKITNVELFQVLKEARRRNWGFSILTNLDNLSFRDVECDDITLRDAFNKIVFVGDVYAIVGFIIVECLEFRSLEIFDGENTITFFENVIHYNGDVYELEKMLMQLSLNPEYWIKWPE